MQRFKCALLSTIILGVNLVAVGQVSFTQSNYPTEFNANPVSTGDFNADDRIDLVPGNASSVSVVLGNGDGSFQPEVAFSLYPPCSYALALAVGILTMMESRT
jgi:hypothetical protein